MFHIHSPDEDHRRDYYGNNASRPTGKGQQIFTAKGSGGPYSTSSTTAARSKTPTSSWMDKHSQKAILIAPSSSSSVDHDDPNMSRDRTIETQTTANSSSVYSRDLMAMEQIEDVLSDDDSDEHGLEYIIRMHNGIGVVRNGINNPNGNINATGSSFDIEEEMNLDVMSDGDGSSVNTEVKRNYTRSETPTKSLPNTTIPYPILINRNSSWVEDKPFDEESILNMSEKDDGDNNNDAVYAREAAVSTPTVQEYFLPPASLVAGQRVMASSSGEGDSVDEIYEIEQDKTTPRMLWGVQQDGSIENSSLASSRERSYGKGNDQRQRSRRLMLLVVAACLVTLLVVGVIIAAVSLSNRNGDSSSLQSAAASSGESGNNVTSGETTTPTFSGSDSATNETTDSPSPNPSSQTTVSSNTQTATPTPIVITTASPTLKATGSPTVTVTTEPSSRPTASPSGVPTGAPSPVPTDSPSGVPTDAPSFRATAAATLKPTAAPSFRATEAPTQRITAAPSFPLTPIPEVDSAVPEREPIGQNCTDTIEVFQECYGPGGNVIVVKFENCNPEPADWVGLYTDGSEFQEGDSTTDFLSDNWITWAWSCGNLDCRESPSSFGFAFPVDLDDPVYNLLNLRAYLSRNTPNAPPFEVIAKSKPFAVVDSCGE